MNARAHDLVVVMHGILGMLPGATAISLHRFTAWKYILIAASTDAAVRVLGHDLGLGAPEIRAAQHVWWLRAMSESGRGELRVEVAGPHHQGPPPTHDKTAEPARYATRPFSPPLPRLERPRAHRFLDELKLLYRRARRDHPSMRVPPLAAGTPIAPPRA